MKNLLFYTISIILLTHAYGDELDKILVFPHAVTVNGLQYSFNQRSLEETLDHNIKALSELSKHEQSDADLKKSDVLLTHLAYGLISAAYFADMTPKMSAILDRVQTDLANRPVPFGILPPDALLMGIASQSFIDSDGQPPDISTSSLGPGRFAMLAGFTKEKIENRKSGKASSFGHPE